MGKSNTIKISAGLVFIILATSFIYQKLGTLDFLMNWDDQMYIVFNPDVTEVSWSGILNMFTSFYLGNYHPVTMLFFAFEYNLSGGSAAFFHLVSLVLHLINVILIFFLAAKIVERWTIAMLITFLFAIHPGHVESVAWISEQKDLLYAMFFISALIIYFNFLRNRKGVLYALALLLFVLSLMCKSMAVTFPAVMLLISMIKFKLTFRNAILHTIPFAIFSLAFGVIAIISQKFGGALPPDGASSIPLNIFLPFYAIIRYVFLLVVPYGLSAVHYYPEIENGILLIIFSLIVAAAIFFLLWRFRKNDMIIFGGLFFLITILPVLQIIPVGVASFAERYTYIPYLGLFLIIGDLLEKAFYDKENRYSMFKPATVIGFSILLLVSCIVSFKRVPLWKDGNTIFSDVIAKNKENPHPYFIRAIALNDKGLSEDAIRDYNMAIQLNPFFEKAYVSKGILLYRSNMFQDAVETFTKALELDSTNLDALKYRSAGYANLNEPQKAFFDLDRAIKIDPVRPELYINRAILSLSMGDEEKACKDLNEATILGSNEAKDYLDKYCIK